MTSFSAAATTLGNIGPGFAVIGPLGNFGEFHPIAKWVLSFLMLAGRLEILTVLVMFTPNFWRRQELVRLTHISAFRAQALVVEPGSRHNLAARPITRTGS